jgi:hypothetical protein
MKDDVRKRLQPIVMDMYEQNFELQGIWNHYIIGIPHVSNDDFTRIAVHEIFNNGHFIARQYYIKLIRKQLRKNKTLDDWIRFAKEFVSGFDPKGNIKTYPPKTSINKKDTPL